MSKSKIYPKVTTQKAKGEGKSPQAKVSPLGRRRLTLIIGLVLIVATLAVFWQVRNHEFLTFDDDDYVTDNPYVKVGLNPRGVIWAFTTTYASNWHPLTWLSHMLDCELYGLNPGGHHVTSLVFHIASTLLLVLVFRRMTGALWKSGFVAALFALHPLHVESVAWVAERKDVLSAFFWMLTMWAYVRYSKAPSFSSYLLVLLWFALGLLSKPMLVTLPFVMLLLDYWPLGRFQWGQGSGDRNSSLRPSVRFHTRRSLVPHLVLEKVPFFVLSTVSSFLTYFAQQRGGTVKSLEFFPLGTRVVNSLVSYVVYMWKMIWPRGLAVLYPYPEGFPIWRVVGAGLLLVGVSVLVIRVGRGRPYLVVGWLWYLGTLVPVIGLVQVGMQAMADRYTYVPLIGLFIMVVWGFGDLIGGWRDRRVAFPVSAGFVVLVLMVVTWAQVRYWKNSITLFSHTLRVTSNNFLIQNKLGNVLFRQSQIEGAMTHYAEALRINPSFVEARNNIGNALLRQGKIDEAMTHYGEALKKAPDYADAHNNLGVALVRQGRIQEAITHYAEALRIKPHFAEGQNNLGFALARQGKMDEAIRHYGEAIRIKPDYAEAHYNLGVALARQGRSPEAASHFSEALRIKPDYAEAYSNLANSLAEQGKIEEAMIHYTQALRIKPDFAEAHYNLGNALLRRGEIEEAIIHYTEAVRTQPNFSEAHFSMGLAYVMIGNRNAAREEYRILRTINPELAMTLSQRIFK
jgi:tetratricopeptide (TPR) repeat protein